MSTETARLILHPVDEVEARRIHDGLPTTDDRWAPDYPFDGDRAGLGALLRAVQQHGVVEVGYGLASSARGHGYATEALKAFVALAASLGVVTVRADTDLDNTASQRVLEKAGFHLTRISSDARYYEIALDPRSAPAR